MRNSSKSLTLIMPLMSMACFALEKPDLSKKSEASESSIQIPDAPLERRNVIPLPKAAPQEKEVLQSAAWLGVRGMPIDQVLAHHTGEDSGIVLQVVAPDSPAAEAGLVVNDIILQADGKPVTSQEDIRQIVQSFEPDAKLQITALCKGEKKQLEISLTQRPANYNQADALPDSSQSPRRGRGFFDFLKPRSPQERSQSSFGQLLDGFGGIQKLIEEVDAKKNWGIDFQSSGTVMIMDEEGTVELKMLSDGKYVVVKDPSGNITFEGPWETEEDMEKANPEIREKINKLNFDKSGIKMRFGIGK